MRYRLTKTFLNGIVTIHASKSESHRSIIAASLAKGYSVINNFHPSNDTTATLHAVEQLGWARCRYDNNRLTIEGGLSLKPHPSVFCGESATTLRMLMPLALIKNGGGYFTGQGMLLKRPMLPYIDFFKEHKITYHATEKYIKIGGVLKSPYLSIDGSVSSQFVSGLLFSLPLLAQNASLHCSTPLVSRPYITLTEAMMAIGGITLMTKPRQWQYHSGEYGAFTLNLEGDYSNGAWFLAANSLGHQIELRGLSSLSNQGDRIIHRIIAALTRDSKPLTLQCDAFVDLVPLLAVLCALRPGVTSLTHLGRLRDKESNRLEAITVALKHCGLKTMTIQLDQITITGQPSFKGGVALSSYKDHRIAMAIALMALHCREPITVDYPDAVAKSYPTFWQTYQQLGGLIDEL